LEWRDSPSESRSFGVISEQQRANFAPMFLYPCSQSSKKPFIFLEKKLAIKKRQEKSNKNARESYFRSG